MWPTAQRLSTQPGKFCIRLRSILFVDKRLQFFYQKLPINRSQAAAAFSGVVFRFDHTRRRCVFVDSFFADVCYRDDDEWLDQFSKDQSLRGFIDSPLDSGK